MKYLGILDIVWVPIFLMVVFSKGQQIQDSNIGDNTAFRFYKKALIFKVLGGIVFALLYALYYGGGEIRSHIGKMLEFWPHCFLRIQFAIWIFFLETYQFQIFIALT